MAGHNSLCDYIKSLLLNKNIEPEKKHYQTAYEFIEIRLQENPFELFPSNIEQELKEKFCAKEDPCYKTISRYMKEIYERLGLFSYGQLEKKSQTNEGENLLIVDFSYLLHIKNQVKKLRTLI